MRLSKELLSAHPYTRSIAMNEKAQYKVTVFHCINSIADAETLPLSVPDTVELKFISLPCSSMVKDVFLLRAFESGADAVAVMVCAKGACRYIEGNLRAVKRVDYVCHLLDEIEFGGRRLALFNIAAADGAAVEQAMGEMLTRLAELGPNPAL
jgi:coenzyme F420-reducing hydrogenase delta subunit